MGVLSTLTFDTIDARHLIKKALLGQLSNEQLGHMLDVILKEKGFNAHVVDANSDTEESIAEIISKGLIDPNEISPLFIIEQPCLERVIHALNGPDHWIRKLQHTRKLPGNANPIDKLIASYNQNCR